MTPAQLNQFIYKECGGIQEYNDKIAVIYLEEFISYLRDCSDFLEVLDNKYDFESERYQNFIKERSEKINERIRKELFEPFLEQ